MGHLTHFMDFVIEKAVGAFPKSNLPRTDRRGAELLILADLADSNPASLAEHLDLIASAPQSNDPFAISTAAARDVLVEQLNERHADTFSKACSLLKTPQALHLCFIAYEEALGSFSNALERNPCSEIDLATGKRFEWPLTPAEESQIKKAIPVIRAASGLAHGWTRIHQNLGSPIPLSLSAGMTLLDIGAEPLDLMSASLSELAFQIPRKLWLGSIDSARLLPLQNLYLQTIGESPDGSLLKAFSDALNLRKQPIHPDEFPAIAEACQLRSIAPAPQAKSSKSARL